MPKISALTAGGALAGTEVVPAVQGGATVKSTIDQIATRVIASDAELAAIAGLTSAADRGMYFTGSGTASLFTFTAAGRAILDDADNTAQRVTLGLVIGTDVQAYNARLADIAGITYAQGDILYHNGSNLVKLAAGTSGHFLKTQGAGANPTWALPSGGTIADADYGDITVSSSGTVFAIDNDVVTYAKMQNVSAAARILGRASGAGSGDVTELTAAQTATILGTEVKSTESLVIACSDETTAITTGTAKVTFRMPYAFTLSAVRASVTTAPTGSTIIIDINESGSTILSTKLSIDASEKTSTTAASAAVISDSALADDAEMTIDFDQVGSTIAGAGVKVYLIGTRA